MPSLYGSDLSYIHDVGFGDFARKSAPGLLKLLRQNEIRTGTVIDLGCGSGIWAEQLDRAGYDVIGVDISPAMIRMCRKRVPNGSFRAGSLYSVNLPQCDAVTCIGECFNYLTDRKRPQNRLRDVFTNVHDALIPNGIFIFDIAVPGRVGKTNPTRHWWKGKDWAILVDATEDTMQKTLTRHITTFRKTSASYRKTDETHKLKLFNKEDVVRDLRKIGFRVRYLQGYGNQKFAHGHIGFLARKANA